ncbi:MAG: ABC transporter substrate-binding protein, partial [Clostridia bacterium]|nr:ABC transporter substrate-binding protein [Clostridia bacterium]
MKRFTKIAALLLALVMIVSAFAACGAKTGDEKATDKADTKEGGNEVVERVQSDDPLSVGYSPFNEKFSPFFSETAYDQDVWAMTQVSLIGNDRTGAMIYKGIEGETHEYNG